VLFRNLEDESAHRRAGLQRRRAGLLPLPRHGAGDLALDGAGQPERAFLLSKLTATSLLARKATGSIVNILTGQVYRHAGGRIGYGATKVDCRASPRAWRWSRRPAASA